MTLVPPTLVEKNADYGWRVPTEPPGRAPSWLTAAAKRRPLIGLVVILLLLAVAYLVSGTAGGSGSEAPSSGTVAVAEGPSVLVATGQVAESALPVQARETLTLIRADGPFPYAQDGAVFGNREKLLPARSSGYYREYTVVTPGEDDRGPRRIVVGQDGTKYCTSDHYSSFRQIAEGR